MDDSQPENKTALEDSTSSPESDTIAPHGHSFSAAGSQFLRELALVVIVGGGITFATDLVIYPALGVSSNAPQPVRTLLVLGLLTWILRRNQESWKNFGLVSFRPLWLLPVLVTGFLAVLLFVAQPFGDALRDSLVVTPPDRSFLRHIQGNLSALFGWLLVAWGIGGFAEELIFRGYLLNRMGRLLGQGPVAWTVAVVGQAVLFGLLHLYLGWGGAVVIGFNALFTGAFFLISKRNLWPLIIVHGLWDSVGLTLVFLSGSPST